MTLCLILVYPGYRCHAQINIKATLSKINAARDDTNKTNLYKDAIAYYKRADLDSAAALAEAGLKVAERIGARDAAAYMHWQKGFIYREQGKLALAKDDLTQAIEIYTALSDQRHIAIVKNELGVVEGTKADYQAATKYFLEALNIYEHIRDTIGMGQTYIKLGVVNQNLRNLDKANSCFHYAFDLSRAKGDTLNMAYLYSNMGIVEGIRENNGLSFRYFDSGLALCTSERFINIKMGLLLNSGIAHARAGDETKALEFYNEGLRIARERSMPHDVPNLLLNIALLDSIVSVKEKMPLLREALHLAKEGEQKSLEVDIYQTLADVSFGQGNYKEAYLYLDSCSKAEKEIFSMKKSKEIANLQALYDLDKSHSKVAQLVQMNYDRNFQRNVIMVVAAVILMALVVSYSSYRKASALNIKLKNGQQELAKANFIKDKIFSVIGHDLRSPTTTIIGMLHVLDNEDSNVTYEERKDIYKTLADHSQASLETLNKLLLWGSREIKGISMQQEQYMANESVEMNMRLLQDRAAEKKLSMVNNVPADTCIFADPSHFDFIVRNLLFNAVKYSKRGGTVTIGVKPLLQDGKACFYVKDEGVGIADELKVQIFNLSSISVPGTDNEKGTGLGLVLCKDLVEQNGGRIWVESEEGRGSVFYFLIKKGTC